MNLTWIKTSILGGAMAACLAIPAALSAQPGEGDRGNRGGGRNWDPAQMFDRMDANNDGFVDRSEFRGGDERFAELDTNKDGKVSREEFSAASAAWGNRRGNDGPRAGGQGGPGGPPPLNLDQLKEKLEASNEEWAVLRPRVEKINTLQMAARGPRGAAATELEALRALLTRADASEEAVQKAISDLRKAREARAAELKAAREELRELLTPKQEAQLIIDGILD